MERLFPLFLKLKGRKCLVVGAGEIAESKIASLLDAEAGVQVVAPRATAKIQGWTRKGQIRWRKRQFHDVDLANCFLVVAATSSSKLHKRIFRLAKRRGVLCDVVDVRNSATSTTLPIYLIFTEGAPSVEFWIALKTYLKGAPCVTVCRSCPVARAPREFFARRKL